MTALKTSASTGERFFCSFRNAFCFYGLNAFCWEENAFLCAEFRVIIMEQSHSLLLNDEALCSLPDHSRPLFVHEWLRYLTKILPLTNKVRSF